MSINVEQFDRMLKHATNPNAAEELLNRSPVKTIKPGEFASGTGPEVSVKEYRQLKVGVACIVARHTRNPELQVHIAKRDKRLAVAEEFTRNEHLCPAAVNIVRETFGRRNEETGKIDERGIASVFRARYNDLKDVVSTLATPHFGKDEELGAERCIEFIKENGPETGYTELFEGRDEKVGFNVVQSSALEDMHLVLQAIPAEHRGVALARWMRNAHITDWSKATWEPILGLLNNTVPAEREFMGALNYLDSALNTSCRHSLEKSGDAQWTHVPNTNWINMVLKYTSNEGFRAAALQYWGPSDEEVTQVLSRITSFEACSLNPVNKSYKPDTIDQLTLKILDSQYRFHPSLPLVRNLIESRGGSVGRFHWFANQVPLTTVTKFLARCIQDRDINTWAMTYGLAVALNTYGDPGDEFRDLVFPLVGGSSRRPGTRFTFSSMKAIYDGYSWSSGWIDIGVNIETDAQVRKYLFNRFTEAPRDFHFALTAEAMKYVEDRFPDASRSLWSTILDLWSDWEDSFEEMLDTAEVTADLEE